MIHVLLGKTEEASGHNHTNCTHPLVQKYCQSCLIMTGSLVDHCCSDVFVGECKNGTCKVCGVPQMIGNSWLHQDHRFGTIECPLKDMSILRLLWVCRSKLASLKDFPVCQTPMQQDDLMIWISLLDSRGISNAILGLEHLLSLVG